MLRTLLISMLALGAACKGKGKANDQGPSPGSASGSGSAGSGSAVPAAKPIEPPTGAAPKLAWKDTDGELLVATTDGTTLTGPCGMTGTLSPTQVAIGTQPPEAWNKVLRDGRKYSFPNLDWVIEVKPDGEVIHARGGQKTPLGTVTGLDSDEAAAWFGAFIVAAPMVQHKLEWVSADGSYKLVLGGAADLRAWEVSDGKAKLASRQREDPAPLIAGEKPPWDPTKIDVRIEAPKTYAVTIARADDALKAAFAYDQYKVTEADDGTLTLAVAGDVKKAPPPIALGKLVGRKACRAHDQAIPALIWTLLGTKAGHAKVFGS